MTSETLLEEYNSSDKLDTYTAVISDRTIPAVAAKYFNLYRYLPQLRDKTVLDLPCGLGIKARRFISEYGANKIIGVDIVQKQLDIAKESDVKAGITDGRIEYYCHDATKPKTFAACLADVCVAAHLFCYAENFDDLIGMCKCVYMNLKSGGELCSMSCSLGKKSSQTIKEKFEAFDQPVIHVDELSGNIYVPRRMASMIKGFNFKVYVWEYKAIVEALRSAGFSQVELRPYVVDPDYSGHYDLLEYMKMIDGHVVIAVK